MQAAQNTAQIFLGINLKCNSCHDSFVSRWKLKDAYSLASYFSAEEKLQLYRCDIAQQQFAAAALPLSRAGSHAGVEYFGRPPIDAAAIFTDPRNGRLPRTLVNRIWQRLMGRGLVAERGRDGRRAVESRIVGLAFRRFRRTRLRSEAPSRNHHFVAHLSDAGESHTPVSSPRNTYSEAPRSAVHRGAIRRRYGAITGEWQVISLQRRESAANTPASNLSVAAHSGGETPAPLAKLRPTTVQPAGSPAPVPNRHLACVGTGAYNAIGASHPVPLLARSGVRSAIRSIQRVIRRRPLFRRSNS